jgi:hypothetical protein
MALHILSFFDTIRHIGIHGMAIGMTKKQKMPCQAEWVKFVITIT